MITDPCVIRLLAEGGAIEVYGHRASGGSWTFVVRGTALDLEDDRNEVIHVSGVPRATDLSDVVPSHWIIFYPRLVHPELRSWFRERYDAAVASLPPHRQTSHDQYRHHKWRALFDSTPPDRWSSADEPFAGHDAVLTLLRPDGHEGNWYHGYVTGLRMECWLCPALFCYFAQAPEKIYVRADPLPVGVNPIWEPPDNEEPRRFVEAPP